VLVLLLVLAVVLIVSGVLMLVAPRRVRAMIQGVRTGLFGERWAARQPMINTPIVGGIGMIVIGIVVVAVLLTEGTRALQ
jgi:hypothetical protein